jgi:hypothetical protein
MTHDIWIAALGLGFALGIRHAFEPDHIVAVSTIVSESRDWRRSSLIGASWGLGHTASLFAAGIAVIGLKLTIPKNMALWMELAVAAMLFGLGFKTMRAAFDGWRVHRHVGQPHLHVHRPSGAGARPFLVGMVHGLAGSGALTILVLGTIPSAAAGLAYIVVFGLGSTGGMLLMSCVMGMPFVLTSGRLRLVSQGLQLLVGFGSMIFGCFYAAQQFSLQ